MRRIAIIVGVLVLCIALGGVATWQYNERRCLVENVTEQAQWFFISLQARNERAVANYLSRTKMSDVDLKQALKAHFKSLLAADSHSLSPRLNKQNGVWFATVDCPDGVTVRFYAEDSGDVWYVYDIRKK